jgi:hypothetical protein
MADRNTFAQLLAQEQRRGDIAGQSARDRAALRYNQMHGKPGSTAYSEPKAAPARAAPARAAPAKAKPAPRPTSRPDPTKTGSTSPSLPATAPLPTPLSSLTPSSFGSEPPSADLAVSPNPYAPGSPVDPRQQDRSMMPAHFGPPMPNPFFPPDLAPSPNPYVPGSPVDPRSSALSGWLAGGVGNGGITPGGPTNPIVGTGGPVGTGGIVGTGGPVGTGGIVGTGGAVGAGRPVLNARPYRSKASPFVLAR